MAADLTWEQRWRDGVDTRLTKLDDEKADEKDVSRLAGEVANLRRAILGFSLTVAGSAVLVLIGLLVSATHGG
jgi:hypothetical protein